MDDLSLAHSSYNCTYHIVFIPKYRRKRMFGELRREVGEAMGKVCKMKWVTIKSAPPAPLVILTLLLFIEFSGSSAVFQLRS